LLPDLHVRALSYPKASSHDRDSLGFWIEVVGRSWPTKTHFVLREVLTLFSRSDWQDALGT
jgi:hypothetical protein